MKPRQPIPRVSKKRLAANGGKPMFSSIRKKPRKPSEFKRIYHSKQRVEWVKSLPCCMCGAVGLSDNAHIKTGGMGRKSDYTQIVPLCRSTPAARGFIFGTGQIGCHDMFHNLGRSVLELTGINFDEYAADTQAAWLAFSGTTERGNAT